MHCGGRSIFSFSFEFWHGLGSIPLNAFIRSQLFFSNKDIYLIDAFHKACLWPTHIHFILDKALSTIRLVFKLSASSSTNICKSSFERLLKDITGSSWNKLVPSSVFGEGRTLFPSNSSSYLSLSNLDKQSFNSEWISLIFAKTSSFKLSGCCSVSKLHFNKYLNLSCWRWQIFLLKNSDKTFLISDGLAWSSEFKYSVNKASGENQIGFKLGISLILLITSSLHSFWLSGSLINSVSCLEE